MTKTNSNETTTIRDNKLGMSSAQRGLWLIKVPKYIQNTWDQCPGNMVAGNLQIIKTPGLKPVIKLLLSEEVLSLKNDMDDEEIPKEHLMNGLAINGMTLGIFSQHTCAEAGSFLTTERRELEGKIIQKLECKPPIDHKYTKLKLEAVKKAISQRRTTEKLTKGPVSYKPVSNHKHNIEYEEKKKAKGKKTREDKAKVYDMLFAEFEKHQYYHFNDLVRITNQPSLYLKEILPEICVYNTKEPHRNTWSLKPEYYPTAT